MKKAFSGALAVIAILLVTALPGFTQGGHGGGGHSSSGGHPSGYSGGYGHSGGYGGYGYRGYHSGGYSYRGYPSGGYGHHGYYGGYSHGGYYGHHDHYGGSVWIGSGFYGWGLGYPYYYPYYPYPYYSAPPVVVEQSPVPYIQRDQEGDGSSYWYFCRKPEGYYPDVKRCPNGWLKVVPSPGVQE